MKIVFHGQNAGAFREGIEPLLKEPHVIATLGNLLDQPGEEEAYSKADIIIGTRFSIAHRPSPALKLYHLPAAGYDGIEMEALPPKAALCNCFGHENAIAEYVMAALLCRHVPLFEADENLRKGDWRWWAGRPGSLRSELGAQSIGILGYGHIGKTVAARAAAFGMKVHVTNRSPVQDESLAATYALDRMAEMFGAVDYVINTLPLAEDTTGLIDADALAAMRPHGVIVNVGRGGVIDEGALFDALARETIGGAVIDTWYRYPTAEEPNPLPSERCFHELPNLLMTPHMSGWTEGTVSRRRQTLAENINRLTAGQPLLNRIR